MSQNPQTEPVVRYGRIFAFVVLATAFMWSVTATARPKPFVSDAVRGASLGLFATDPDYDYAVMLGEMRARGATDVLIVYRLMMVDIRASRMTRVDGHSPSEDTLRRTLIQAKRLGFRVGLMPIIGLEHRLEGEWRGTLVPAEGAERWFESYRTHLAEAALLAERTGVHRLVVGSELNSLESHDTQWSALISEVREAFSGRVAYSANWDQYMNVPFWSLVDEIAVSAYFEVGSAEAPLMANVALTWEAKLSELHAFARSEGKPLVLSEVGYPAHSEAAAFPWDETRDASLDVHLQAELLAAFCRSYAMNDSVQDDAAGGYYVWNWFGHGGHHDSSYCLRGKPVAAEFERCMRSAH